VGQRGQPIDKGRSRAAKIRDHMSLVEFSASAER
jgi:hypothetical protein